MLENNIFPTLQSEEGIIVHKVIVFCVGIFLIMENGGGGLLICRVIL
jgi:hypothetical protein